MKALSIKQPWAWAICNLPEAFRKDYENRTWNTKFRGEFLVHASKGFDAIGYERMCGYLLELGYEGEISTKKEFVYGALVGKTRLTEVTQKPKSIWFEGEYGFKLDRTIAFDEPIPHKGQLNFFNVDDEIVKEQISLSGYDLDKIEFKLEKRFMSNMWDANIIMSSSLVKFFPEFEFDNKIYASSEHLYQALKSRSPKWRELIYLTPEPTKTKSLARKLLGSKYPIREDWNDVKDKAMKLALYLKFSQHPELLKKLKDVSGHIEERNCWGDEYWGTCDGKGFNKLGEMLMNIRDNGCEELLKIGSKAT